MAPRSRVEPVGRNAHPGEERPPVHVAHGWVLGDDRQLLGPCSARGSMYSTIVTGFRRRYDSWWSESTVLTPVVGSAARTELSAGLAGGDVRASRRAPVLPDGLHHDAVEHVLELRLRPVRLVGERRVEDDVSVREGEASGG